MGNVKNIAILFGGASSEYTVSLQSAYAGLVIWTGKNIIQ